MKVILITGSTDGIGKLTAIKLAQAGHQLYLHGRNRIKLDEVIAEIKSTTGNNNIDGFIADLSNMQAVEQLANDILASLTKLDVLINNAGVFKTSAEHTEEGFDKRFAVNYLAPYKLTNKLLPLLNKSHNPRVINLSSAAQATVSHEALSGKVSLDDQAAYAQSKLALTMWSFEFARQHTDITVIAVNPGSLLNTNMVAKAYGNHWSSADKGANVLYELATNEQFSDKSGQYFDNDLSPKQSVALGDFGQAHNDAYDKHKILALMETTKQISN